MYNYTIDTLCMYMLCVIATARQAAKKAASKQQSGTPSQPQHRGGGECISIHHSLRVGRGS